MAQVGQMTPASRRTAEALLTTLCLLAVEFCPLTDGGPPHQFRTRNDAAKTQRTLSNSNETAAKSTNLIDIPSLITGWLRLRVLPAQLRRQRFALDHRTTNVISGKADRGLESSRERLGPAKEKQTNGSRLGPRCEAAATAFISLSSPVRFPLQSGRMPDRHLLTLLSSSFLVFHTNNLRSSRAAQCDNQLDVSEATFETDAAAIVIWNVRSHHGRGA
jgi:hypothetical protein